LTEKDEHNNKCLEQEGATCSLIGGQIASAYGSQMQVLSELQDNILEGL